MWSTLMDLHGTCYSYTHELRKFHQTQNFYMKIKHLETSMKFTLKDLESNELEDKCKNISLDRKMLKYNIQKFISNLFFHFDQLKTKK